MMDVMDGQSNTNVKPFSLFPAYTIADQTDEKQNFPSPLQGEWLKNASFNTTDAARLQESKFEIPQLTSQESVCEDVQTTSEASEHPTVGKHLYVSSENSTEEEISEKHQTSHHHKKKKKKKKKKYKKSKHHHDDSDHSQKVASRSSLTQSSSVAPVISSKIVFSDDLSEVQATSMYRVDRGADPSNYTYRSIYKLNIARYHHHNACLGSASLLMGKPKDRNKTKHRYYKLLKCKKPTETAEEEVLVPLLNTDRVIVEKPHRTEIPPLGEFVPISDPEPTPATPGSEEQLATGTTSLKSKTAELNSHLAQDPHDIEAWLELVQLQNDVFQDGGDLGIGASVKHSERLKKQESMVLQMKEAIMERALRENPASITLMIHQMELCGDHWDQSKMIEQWKQLLFSHPNNLTVWQKYLDFVESKVNAFKVTKLIKAYKKCFHVLRGLKDNQMKSHPPQKGTEDFLIEMFVRLCYRLRQAGHVEKAVGLFQALLEYNLFYPEAVQNLTEHEMEYFTAYWESDAAHIGEDGATGWAGWMETKGAVQPAEALVNTKDKEELEEKLVEDHPGRKDLWCAMEKSRSLQQWLPWRPDIQSGETTESCEDPESLVLSDDVTYALFLVDTDQRKLKLLRHFVEFLGISCKSHHSVVIDNLSDTHRYIGSDVTLEGIHQLPHQEIQGQGHSQPKEHNYSKKHVFINNLLSQAIKQMTKSGVVPNYVCNQLIMLYVGYVRWTLTLPSDDPKQAAKEVKTTFKELLQNDPFRNSLLAWQQYAMLECFLGNLRSAKKVLDVTITGFAGDLSSLKDAQTLCLGLLLYQTYAEMELGLVPVKAGGGKVKVNQPSPSLALQVLVSACENSYTAPSDKTTVSGTQLLKCQRVYDSRIKECARSWSRPDSEVTHQGAALDKPSSDLHTDYSALRLLHWAICSVYFSYLSSGLDGAAHVFHDIQTTIDRCVPKSTKRLSDSEDVLNHLHSQIQENLTLVYISVIQHHLVTNRAPLRVLRDPLRQALVQHPDSPELLSAYIQLELRSSFTGTLRQYLAGTCRETESATVWVLAIQAEISKIRRLQATASDNTNLGPEACMVLPEISLIHVVRTWFERAVTSPAGRKNVLLWRLYLQFEIEHGKPDKVKGVFYRGIQQCPWSKWLCVDYIASDSEGLDTVDLMIEKELRVHTPPEEIDILLETSHTPPDSPS